MYKIDRFVGLVVKASPSRAEDPALDLKIGTPGVIGSVLGLVGPVSVYCDWVSWRAGSATFVSVWHVKLSQQIRP